MLSDPPFSVCVFCGSRAGNAPHFRDAAVELGQTAAREGVRIVYGGGSVGLMGVIADAALAAGGEVFGVLPRNLFAEEVAHRGLTRLFPTQGMHERKALMNSLSDAFLVLPGGFGTLDETFEALTWRQIGIHEKPVGLLNVAGYFDPLRAQITNMVDAGFVSSEHAALVGSYDTPADALSGLRLRARESN